jgi:hypothetical protein
VQRVLVVDDEAMVPLIAMSGHFTPNARRAAVNQCLAKPIANARLSQ